MPGAFARGMRLAAASPVRVLADTIHIIFLRLNRQVPTARRGLLPVRQFFLRRDDQQDQATFFGPELAVVRIGVGVQEVSC